DVAAPEPRSPVGYKIKRPPIRRQRWLRLPGSAVNVRPKVHRLTPFVTHLPAFIEIAAADTVSSRTGGQDELAAVRGDRAGTFVQPRIDVLRNGNRRGPSPLFIFPGYDQVFVIVGIVGDPSRKD